MSVMEIWIVQFYKIPLRDFIYLFAVYINGIVIEWFKKLVTNIEKLDIYTLENEVTDLIILKIYICTSEFRILCSNN